VELYASIFDIVYFNLEALKCKIIGRLSSLLVTHIQNYYSNYSKHEERKNRAQAEKGCFS